MVTNAFKTIVIGGSSLSCLALLANHLYADEKGSKSLINIRRDTISAIPDNPFKGNQQSVETFNSLVQATRASRDLVQQTMTTNGYPGIVIGVSIKGKPCWIQGFGFSNIETGTRCTKNTVMRIASISKPITMAGLGKLYEENKIDLDKSIYDYLGDKFPEKKFNNEKVNITIRQLASHLGGIRHYKDDEVFDVNLLKPYSNSVDALEIFSSDDLVAKPGTQFNYSTYGYTLIAATVEKAVPTIGSFGQYLIREICQKKLGMVSTYLDENSPIILNRAKQYTEPSPPSKQKISNSPYVECSYKYAGGGLLSTVPDLLRFGNAMMYSYLPHLVDSTAFLKKSTVDMLWTPVPFNKIKITSNLVDWGKYGLGWCLILDAKSSCTSGACPPFKDIIYHTGDATGGASLLMIIPEKEMVVALLINLKRPKGFTDLGLKVAELFSNVKLQQSIDLIINPKEIIAKE